MNMPFPSREQVESIRKNYPPGIRVMLLGMEGNRRLDGGSVIAGPFFVIGDAGENFRSLTDAEVNRYLQMYAEPQQISQREVRADMGMTFYCF